MLQFKSLDDPPFSTFELFQVENGNNATLHSDIHLIESLHNGPSFLSLSQRFENLRLIIFTATVICALHICLLTALRFKNKKCTPERRKEILKDSYQATNLLVNLFLGIYGIYQWKINVPNINTLLATRRIIGFHKFIPFAAIQIGYNIWALFVGAVLVNESKAMLGHHVATLCVTSISCFCSNGFRYHAPFFYGAIEISSVPLSIMNYLKTHRDWAKKTCPTVNVINRIVFALTFLIMRVILWTPQILDVLRNVGLLFYTCETNVCKAGTGSFFISAVFLSMLQYYWGALVLKGILSIVTGGGRKSKSKVKQL